MWVRLQIPNHLWNKICAEASKNMIIVALFLTPEHKLGLGELVHLLVAEIALADLFCQLHHLFVREQSRNILSTLRELSVNIQ
jgi:hypothetical protein